MHCQFSEYPWAYPSTVTEEIGHQANETNDARREGQWAETPSRIAVTTAS